MHAYLFTPKFWEAIFAIAYSFWIASHHLCLVHLKLLRGWFLCNQMQFMLQTLLFPCFSVSKFHCHFLHWTISLPICKIRDWCSSFFFLLPDEVPFYVATDERIVELQGETLKVLKALEAIVGHLRKFLVDHSVLPLFEKNVS